MSNTTTIAEARITLGATLDTFRELGYNVTRGKTVEHVNELGVDAETGAVARRSYVEQYALVNGEEQRYVVVLS